MDMGLTGRVVLITGAGRNIGRATAEAFAAEGARLVLTTRRSSGPPGGDRRRMPLRRRRGRDRPSATSATRTR